MVMGCFSAFLRFVAFIGFCHLLVLRCLLGTASRSLSTSVYCIADVPFRRRLRSAFLDAVIVHMHIAYAV